MLNSNPTIRKPLDVRPSHGRKSIRREFMEWIGVLAFMCFLMAALGYVGGLDRRLEYLESHADIEEPYMAPDAPVWPTEPTDNVQGASAPELEEI